MPGSSKFSRMSILLTDLEDASTGEGGSCRRATPPRMPVFPRSYAVAVKHIVNHEKPAATTADVQDAEATS
jgi:hypothetical protein